ncbi:BREX system serine/threonine kinase PglW [Streptomyces alkaliterrae]|uniref:BREX system serine/threonine kinase PglW n=1 Tax=Streptomyces alkaliterrae TaxID=2213162 RepID=A0A5P0YLJ0_9ACTN|nr:BREX system serine/threonine kinase PglW [Streptomyces alkaliterrae]MBB1257840.1 BREX system serine/threonine kinase PglW [Streptomyces alkaliterrae]MQS01118.1 BREX system serine/threonine kinase PglW [Streptomyces alkaliterrae]
MREGRWVTVTESEFEHERRGLEAIRKRLPDAEPWRAWSNFTFTAVAGHVREVDLLVVAPGGVCMIELKDWHGSVTSENGTWVQTTPSGRRRTHGNPLHLVNRKAKELAELLTQTGTRRVWVAEAVCFTDNRLHVRLPAHDQNGVYTVTELVEMLGQPPRDERRRVTAPGSREIAAALKKIGIRKSDAQYKVGPYELERKSFDSGPTWVDYLARHSELPEAARVRIYLTERGSDNSLRQSVENAARREAAVLGRFKHPGVVELKQYFPSGHAAGPALIFDYHPNTLKLDEYLVQYGEKLDILGRMALVRQLAETMRSAHSSRIHHRALAARSVHVVPRPRGLKGRAVGEDAAWLAPRLQISDWQIATQRSGDSSQGQGMTRFAPTALSAQHLGDDADPYLAPELTALRPDPVSLDVYGLGVLTYLLVTGKAPAASQAELLARLEAGEGLRPSGLVDGLSEDVDELVQAATAYRPELRLASVDEFLELLEVVEDSLTAPAAAATDAESSGEEEETPADKDPLEAVAGDVLSGRWEIRRRLGTGSTSRAFLVRDLHAEARGTRPLAVLKVALSDSRGEILKREAEAMGRLRPHSGIIRLVEPDPLDIGGRTVLALEYVGDERDEHGSTEGGGRPRRREETVARQLRENGRLQVDQLEAYGDYLFGAVDFLEGEGIWHRDIKPDNIAIRIRPNRTRELVLIDFSLAGYPAKRIDAGTDGYLDPFVGVITRGSYDSHAERYALAVTLHQMASGELPKWGDGGVPPRMTDPEQWPYPTIAAEAFDPAVMEGLVAFFRKALHRDAAKRFPELKPMRDAWRKVFLDASQAVPSSHRSRHPAATTTTTAGEGTSSQGPAATIADAEPETAEQQRDRLAAEVTRDTPLTVSGLTPAAQSFLYGLEITTVGELLDYSRRKLVNAPGLGAKTRNEVQRRQREWGERLREAPVSPLTAKGRAEAKEELDQLTAVESAVAGQLVEDGFAGALSARTLRSISLDTLATVFVPAVNNNGSNRNKAEMVRLLLRLPDENGVLPDIGVWPKQKDVAEALGLSHGRIPQMLKEERKRWKAEPAVQALREEIIDLLVSMGRVASAAEIADALAVRRGTQLAGREQRRAMALAAVRAVVEVEQLLPQEAEFQHQPNRKATDESLGAGLLALDVRENDGPDTPTAPGLLEYATRLGRTADRLARQDTLPTAATVLAELGALTAPPGTVDWDERRMVELAAAASVNAAATPRLEIYPRDLSLVRALRLTQAGLVRWIPGMPDGQQPGLTAETVHERVRARFPEMVAPDGRGGTTHDLPTDGPLTKALRDAGFELALKMHEQENVLRYLPIRVDHASSYRTIGTSRQATTMEAATRYDDPELADAVRAEERLLASARRDGYRVLTVRQHRVWDAVRELSSRRFGAHVLSVTELFLHALRAQVTPGTKPTWETLLKADAAEPGSKSAVRFAEYTRTAWGSVEPRIAELLRGDDGGGGSGGARPVLLTEAAVFARYDAMGVLDRLAAVARQGGRGLWLLTPQPDPSREPRLGQVAVPYQAGLGEWIELPDNWVLNKHRGAGDMVASGVEGDDK